MMAPHDEDNRNSSKQSKPHTDLEPPFCLSELNSPVFTLSLAFAPSDLTPVAIPTDALVESYSKLSMHSPSMPILSTESSLDRPPADVHSKMQSETPRRSKRNAMNSVVRAFSSSKTLHQVLGMREPEPFVVPPEMPHDLGERFEAGLHQYEQLFAAGVFASNEAEDIQAVRQPQKSKTGLADILEEKESPVRATPVRAVVSSAGFGLKINVPEWTSGKQAVAVAQRYTFLDSDSDAANDTASEHTDYELDVEDYSSWRYDSSTTLAVSDYSRPGSSASGSELSSVPAPSFPPRTSSLLPHCRVNTNQDFIDPSLRLPNKKALPPGLLTQSTRPTASAGNPYPNEKDNDIAYGGSSNLRRAGSLPVLFPSLGAKSRSWDVEQTGRGFVPSGIGSNFEHSHYSEGTNVLEFKSKTASPSVPQITIQAPSPKKAPTSRKRAPPSDQNDIGPPVSQRARRDDTVGLPALSSDTEALWKFKFPGNTHALLTVLLTWSQTMWSLHHRLPDPKLFAIHPTFPYLVSPPLTRKLLSVSFYDTSIEPHKEVRFLGPGDVAEMSYHEVDVFSDLENQWHEQRIPEPSFPIGAIKQTLGLAGSESAKHIRYTSVAQRAKTGEGRWCYILLKGHQTLDKATPPHVILAWHISAVTATSNCLHTIYPDNAPPKPPARPQSNLKRFSSLQNLGTALRKPARFNFHQTLRSASSSSELSPVDASAEMQPRGSLTLHRTVLKLERAGGIPLIEGFRVDIAAFRGWLDACGKGKGKVIMWRERDGG